MENLNFEIIYEKKRYLLTEDLTFKVVFESNKGAVLKEHYLMASGNNETHFLTTKEVLKGESSVKMDLKPTSSSTISTLPSSLKISLHDKNGSLLHLQFFTLKVSRFTETFFKKISQNLLVYGFPNSSKSMFLNDLFCIINSGGKKIEIDKNQRMNSFLKMNILRDLEDRNKTQIALWDVR